MVVVVIVIVYCDVFLMCFVAPRCSRIQPGFPALRCPAYLPVFPWCSAPAMDSASQVVNDISGNDNIVYQYGFGDGAIGIPVAAEDMQWLKDTCISNNTSIKVLWNTAQRQQEQMDGIMQHLKAKIVDKNYVNNTFHHCLNQNNADQYQGITDLVANMLHQNNAAQSQGLKDFMQAEVQVIKDGIATNLGTLQTLLEKYNQVRGYVDYLFKTMTWANMDEHGNVIFKWDYLWARFLDYEKSQKEKYGTLEEVLRKMNGRISTLEHEQAMHKNLIDKLHARIKALEAQRLPKRFRGKKFRGKRFRSRRSKKMPPKRNAGHFIVLM
jgi:hypothetical protein